MPRSARRQTKADKARYDKERKAFDRKERRFTKPLKLFIQRKYPAQYDEFVKFFNLMENTYQGKKDLTKTEMFTKFLNNHPPQETELYPNIASLLESTTSPTEATSQAFPNTLSEYPIRIPHRAKKYSKKIRIPHPPLSLKSSNHHHLPKIKHGISYLN